ncbi:unnamed protein product [Pleuronectes platessa]|uniref:Uncharacterized protein n=1 Tax=Pleuronectes platessa TaxID=8262 RepID=A0A9N7YX01_PLEPL|nr:unnamed protein product [Pleuronectes platessa]
MPPYCSCDVIQVSPVPYFSKGDGTFPKYREEEQVLMAIFKPRSLQHARSPSLFLSPLPHFLKCLCGNVNPVLCKCRCVVPPPRPRFGESNPLLAQMSPTIKVSLVVERDPHYCLHTVTSICFPPSLFFSSWHALQSAPSVPCTGPTRSIEKTSRTVHQQHWEKPCRVSGLVDCQNIH